MMPSAPLTVSLSRAEDIRGSFTQLVRTASNNRLPNVTLSAGLAVFPADATSASELRRCADVALYAAKRGGRDRVMVYTERIGAQSFRGAEEGLAAQPTGPKRLRLRGSPEEHVEPVGTRGDRLRIGERPVVEGGAEDDPVETLGYEFV